MRLEFQLLVIDDNLDSIASAIGLLEDHLAAVGFTLKCHAPPDRSAKALRALAGGGGKEFDLVAIDYHLNQENTDGASIAGQLRRLMPYTDMVFFSSDPQANLHDELAKAKVAGVFIADRQHLDDALKGLADTVIGKAVDLNHMRGIAMAEVAEMDVLMEEVLERAFSSDDAELVAKGKESLAKLLDGAETNLERLRALVKADAVLDVVTDGLLFNSMQRYKAVNRISKCLAEKPAEAIEVLKGYDPDILQNRNTLAHAKEDVATDGTVTLRAVKRGKPPVAIDDEWMTSFRGKLHRHKAALSTVCNAINSHVDGRRDEPKQA